jgi:Matrixin
MKRPLLLCLIALMSATVLATVSVNSAFASSRHPAGMAHAHIRRTRTRIAHAAVASRNPVTTAASIAEGYWGAVPCAGQITIAANRPVAAGLDSDTDGWVTFNSSLGPDDLDAPASSYTACTITLAHWRWASWSGMEGDWGMFCLTVVHEMGHLLGHKHSLVPGSVMAPVFTSDANVPSVCNQTWLPGWRSAANSG